MPPPADLRFRRTLQSRGYDAARIKALRGLLPGECAGGDFFEQVEYSSRRLAKLNMPPQEVLDALAACGRPAPADVVARIYESYYQVREAETQAFYGLFRAEVEARDLDDLLRRSVEILTRTFRAATGLLVLLDGAPASVARRLSGPRYIERGTPAERLVLDPTLHGRYACYWSIPLVDKEVPAGVIQFGFPTPYRWLPRELNLFDAIAERCLAAIHRTRLIRDLGAREEQVRQLAAHLIDAGEEERTRIGRELHDEAGQSLLLLRLGLETLESSAPEGESLRRGLAESRELAGRVIEDIRRVIAALNPAVLERLGLTAALRHLANRFGSRGPAAYRLQLPSPFPRLSPKLETVIYRLSQECFQNALKHSGASRVNLSLKTTDKWLELSVKDNGAGFDVDRALLRRDSFGLAGMRERVALLGGTLRIRSAPGRGTAISAELPLD